MQNRLLVLLAVLTLGLVSCDSKRVYDSYQSLPNQWHKDSVITFKINPPDTIQPYNLFVNLRNTNDYPFKNLFLIVEMDFPHGKTVTDTLEYEMAKADGELLGAGFSDIKESKLWYKEGVVFKEAGEYLLKVQQAMRENGEVEGVEYLKGVTDVGFRIEKTEQK